MNNINIPNLPVEKLTLPNGDMHPYWYGVMSQLITTLQQNLSSEGYVVPQQNTATITKLNTAQSIGALLYDNETHQLKVNINGTFKVVQVV